MKKFCSWFLVFILIFSLLNVNVFSADVIKGDKVLSFDDFKKANFVFGQGGSTAVNSDGSFTVKVDGVTTSNAASIARMDDFMNGKCADGDVMTLSFTARLTSGGENGKGAIQVQQEVPKVYTKCLFEKFEISSDWQTYTFTYTANKAASNFAVRLGFYVQTIEFKDFCVYNGGQPSDDRLKMVEIFSDGMVLQRGKPIPVWGHSSDEGGNVTVTLGDKTVTTTVSNGEWRTELPAFTKATGLTMTVKDSVETLTFKDVAIGDVILLMGQSNMAFQMKKAYGCEDIIKDASSCDIRRYRQEAVGSYTKMDDNMNGSWIKSDENTVLNYEAVGYIAAYQLAKKHNVTIGLLGCNKGSSLIETFMDYDLFTTRDNYKVTIDLYNTKKDKNDDWWVQVPSGLYNQMIHPFIPYAISSAVWYQGEANATRSELYAYQIYDLINDYRQKFNSPDMPFVVVQLAPYSKKDHKDINQVFLDTHKRMDNVAVVSTANEGPKGYTDEEEIHPMTKRPVGDRVFYSLDNILYGEEYEYSGPEYMYMKYKDKKPVLYFSHTGKGLKIANGETELKGFKASKDGVNFENVSARIEGNTVVIDMVDAIEVRYSFVATESNGTLGGNLTNDTDIPAFPFRASLPDVEIVSAVLNKSEANTTADITVRNKGYSEFNPKFFVAVYEGQKLVSVKIQTEKISTVDEIKVSLPVDYKNDTAVRTYVWDGNGSIKAYTASHDVK